MVDFEDKHDRDDELEQGLRRALRPLSPPEGFADRVLNRSGELQAPGSRVFGRQAEFHPTLRWAIAAVLLVTISIGGVFIHQRQRRVAGERARDQVLLALRITSITIQAVRNQVTRDNHKNGQQQETP